MLVRALLIALLAGFSSWWFFGPIHRTLLTPLWTGFLVGIIMGEPVLGMMAGANIQLLFLGWISAGGTIPSNTMVAGIFGTTLTILSGADPKLAVTFAIPFSLLGLLIWQIYLTVNSLWVHRADRYLEQGNLKGVFLMNYLPSGILSFILNGIPAFLLVMVGKDWATGALASIPTSLISALEVVGAIMPALGIAMLLGYLGKKNIMPFFFLGFFLTMYLNLDTMAITVFGAIIAIISYYSGGKAKIENVVKEKKKLSKSSN